MENTALLPRRPYCRRSEDEWGRIRQMYRQGASAKALAEAFGGTERTIYSRLRKEGCLRKDIAAEPPAEPMPDGAAQAAAEDIQLTQADQPLRALGPDATPEAAARASFEASILHLRKRQLPQAYQLARLSAGYERLGRAQVLAAGEGGPSPAQAAVIEFLVGRLTGQDEDDA